VVWRVLGHHSLWSHSVSCQQPFHARALRHVHWPRRSKHYCQLIDWGTPRLLQFTALRNIVCKHCQAAKIFVVFKHVSQCSGAEHWGSQMVKSARSGWVYSPNDMSGLRRPKNVGFGTEVAFSTRMMRALGFLEVFNGGKVCKNASFPKTLALWRHVYAETAYTWRHSACETLWS